MSRQINITDSDLQALQTVAEEVGIDYSGMNAQQLALALASNIIMYSKEGCPYCENAKTLLKRKGIPFQTINVSPEMKEKVKAEINRKARGKYSGTFPAIFSGNRFIGGYDDLQKEFGEQDSSCIVM